MKQQNNFAFEIPVNEITSLNGLTHVVNHGNITVYGFAYKYRGDTREDPVEFDVDKIEWNGLDVTELIQFSIPGFWATIEELAERHAYESVYDQEENIPLENKED